MSFSVGIVGLPNAGKSTLFKILTKQAVDIANYPFTTINPNVGVVMVPDQRLKKIFETIKPQKITPATIEFVDIAGLVKNAHKGEGLGNQFLARIRDCDAIIEVIRGFENPNVEHVIGSIDPKRDIEIIKIELLMKDLEALESISSKMEKEEKENKKLLKKRELLNKIKDWVSQGKTINELILPKEEELEIKEYRFLTAKPIVYILNITKESENLLPDIEHLAINMKEEEEISELKPEDLQELGIKEKIKTIDQLILACYNMLDLITFYTIAGNKELRAWTLKKGQKAPEAGGVVHTDFKEKFIRAEAINWQKLTTAGSWQKSRELGWLKIVGHDYAIENGDILEFKI